MSPLVALAALLRHSHALLAHLASVRVMLTRRSDELDRAEAELALQAAAADVATSLGADPKQDAQAAPAPQEESPELPAQLAGEALLPWLRRRLILAEQAAQRVAAVAQVLHPARSP